MMLQQKPANQKMIYTQSGTKGPWAFKFPKSIVLTNILTSQRYVSKNKFRFLRGEIVLQ